MEQRWWTRGEAMGCRDKKSPPNWNTTPAAWILHMLGYWLFKDHLLFSRFYSVFFYSRFLDLKKKVERGKSHLSSSSRVDGSLLADPSDPWLISCTPSVLSWCQRFILTWRHSENWGWIHSKVLGLFSLKTAGRFQCKRTATSQCFSGSLFCHPQEANFLEHIALLR